MNGVVSQVLSSGNFMIWCAQTRERFSVFLSEAVVQLGHPARVGDAVTFEVRDGDVVRVSPVRTAESVRTVARTAVSGA